MSGVSVIISAYKASEFIEECLDSILEQQTNFDYEVLVGVDGCPDTLNKIKDILYKYKDFNFRFYYFEINVGKYLMVNSMAKESIYDNLAFFDVDDIMMNNFIEDNFKHLSDNLKTTGFRSVEFKGVNVDIIRNTPHVTDNGWIGPDHPSTATEEWGKEMLETTANYIVDFMEEFKKVELS